MVMIGSEMNRRALRRPGREKAAVLISRVTLATANCRPASARGASIRVLETWPETQMRLFGGQYGAEGSFKDCCENRPVRTWTF